ncbi:MAG: DNA polymerase III subunit beta [Acidobacteria bacterium]|nr:DNA polymerase III subunit beta [Acidobacteriota bacterium]
MEFTVSKADLVRELNLSQGVVEKKTTIPILSNVLLEVSGDRVMLTATDLELGIRCSAPAVVKSAGAGTIPAKRLLDYVRLLPDADVVVKFSDSHWASLTCGRSKTRIAGMSRESYPELPQMAETVAQFPIGVLAGMISKTIFAISAEESRFTLNGALIQIKGRTLTMVATDGHRLSLVECENPLESEANYRALLPRKAMAEIMKLAADAEAKDAVVGFSGDENHLFFQLGSRLLISRKLTGNFPDFERVLPKSHSHTVELDRDELRASIERVAQFSDERTRAIKIRFADNEATIHSSLSESGESEESLGVDYGGPTVEIGFNAQYLMDFLRALPESKAAFHFKDAQSAGELTPSGDGVNYKYRYVVMPMRI